MSDSGPSSSGPGWRLEVGHGGGIQRVVAHERCPSRRRLDVLGDDVDLEVDRVAGALAAQGGDLGGVRDDGDGEAVVVDGGHGEADAVDGDRALLDHVAEQVVGARATRRSGAGVTMVPTPSTWPWTRWPPRRSARRTGPLEVDRVAGLRGRRGWCGRRSRRRRRPPTSRRPGDDGEAGAVDGDGGARARRRRARWWRRCAAWGPRRETTVPSSSTMPVNIRSPPWGVGRRDGPGPRAMRTTGTGPVTGDGTTGRRSMRRSPPSGVTPVMRAPPDVGDGRGARAGEQRPGVVAAEQRRRQVERRSGRPGRPGGTHRRRWPRPRPAPGARPGRRARRAGRSRSPGELERRVDLGARAAPCRARPAAGRGPRRGGR